MFDFRASTNPELFSKADRFLVVRNPYVRFVSSYMDWQSRAGDVRANVSFSQFIEMVQNRSVPENMGSTLWDHIDPVAKTCDYTMVGYAAFLRVEEQSLWYDALLNEYNLTEPMEQYKRDTGNTVFEHGLNADSTVYSLVESIVGAQPWPGKALASSHHRGSSNKIFQFYTSPQIVDVVTKLVWDDLVHFSYPVWDGNPNSFRYV